jgi:PAS domain S-box-containing protein
VILFHLCIVFCIIFSFIGTWMDWKKLRHRIQPYSIVMPTVVALSTLLLTAVATYYLQTTALNNNTLRFSSSIHQTQDNIQDQFKTSIALLNAGKGLFAANPQVSRDMFRAFTNQLALRQQYPGIQGIGFSQYVPAAEKEALIAQLQQQEPVRSIRPDYDRSEYHAILYLEPADRRNLTAIGYDMFTDPVRREAMERARDTGTPALSGRVRLVQEIDQRPQAGFLIYVPIYRNGLIPTTVSERRAALQGFIYSPFRADDFIRGTFGTYVNGLVDFSIYDGTIPRPEQLLHRSSQSLSPLQQIVRSPSTQTTTLNIAGHPWTFIFTARPALAQMSAQRFVPLVAVLGGLISLILFAVMRLQVKARLSSEQAARDLHLSEQELQEANVLLDTLINNAPLGVGIWDEQLRFVRLNNALIEMNGLSQETHVGKTVAELFPHVSSAVTESLRQVVKTGRSVIAQEVSGETPAAPGQHRYWSVTYYPIRLPDGVTWVGAICEEITERKQAEVEREQLLIRAQAARDHAETANRIKDEFLAILSHELRSPLSPILGWAKLLQVGTFDHEQTVKALETIEQNAKLQAQLIEDLLDVSKILRGKLSLDAEPVDLVETIQAALETVKLSAAAKSIQIKTTLTPKVCLVQGDKSRLQQVIWNLLSNAIKFTPNGGQVEIRLEQQLTNPQETLSRSLQQSNAYAQITVMDNGKGISPEFLPHLFESFRQEDSQTTRKFGGLGLGLAIVRQVVELHGGMVQAESPGIGQGATLTVRLPMIKALSNLQTVQSPPVATDWLDLAGMSVLVVDDEPDMRDLLKVTLKSYGAVVVAAASAAEALAILEQFQPQVLVSDIGMPNVDGYTLIQNVRQLPADKGGATPAIALTAYVGEVDQQQAFAAGFQKHIAKPIEPEELVKAILDLSREIV